MSNFIETPHYRIEVGEDRIVRFWWKPGVDVTLEIARQSEADARELAPPEPVGLLVHLGEVKSIDRDARVFFSNLDGVSAVALVGVHPVARMIGNLFLGLNRSPVSPTRLFPDEKEAAAWLKGFL